MKTKLVLTTMTAIVKTINRKWLLTFLLPISIMNHVFSQQAQKPTTDLEYNYVTTGYRIQFAQGLDIKKGYLLKDILSQEDETGTVKLKGFYRVGEARPCAIMVIFERKVGSPVFLCIPSYDADQTLWDKFDTSLNTFELSLKLFLYTLATAEMKAYQK